MGNSCVTSQDIDRKVKPASNNAAATLKPPVSSAISRQSSKVHPSKSSPPEYESSHWNQQEVLSMSNNSDKSTRFSSFTSRRSMIFFRRASNVKKCETLVIANNHSSVLMKIDQQILQKYLIHNEIGKGASSTIVLIEDKLTSVQYALKISEKKKAYSNSIPWEREIEILRRVRHPNIVYLLEAHATSNKVYSVLELAFGGDLAQRLDRVGYFTEAKTISLMSSIIDAVRYLHKHGVTHRDIKMENCLFKTGDDDSKIMLSDFGLAHLNLDTNTTDGMKHKCSYHLNALIVLTLYHSTNMCIFINF
jgi:tRNA A-37 threonylcarbamoyl transferase component Bud32